MDGAGALELLAAGQSSLEALAGVEYNGGCWELRGRGAPLRHRHQPDQHVVFRAARIERRVALGSNPLETLRRNIGGFVRDPRNPQPLEQRGALVSIAESRAPPASAMPCYLPPSRSLAAVAALLALAFAFAPDARAQKPRPVVVLDRIVAVVNDEVITRNDLDERVEARVRRSSSGRTRRRRRATCSKSSCSTA